MKIQSAKSKGRFLQKWIVGKILELYSELDADDVRSCPMSSNGADVILSPAAQQQLGISIEAKNQERVNIWAGMAQARRNCLSYEPVLVVKKNHQTPLAVVDADYFFKVLHLSNDKS